MKRAPLIVGAGALAVLAACSSGPSATTVNGELSAHTRSATDVGANAQATTAPRHHATTTEATVSADRKRHRGSSTTVSPTTFPSTPTTPTTMASNGVAGAAVTQSCSKDGECTMHPGQQAALKLLDSKGNVVASGHTRNDGAFIIPAAPGTYTLAAKAPERGVVCDPQTVTVQSGHYTSVLVTCHSK